MPKILQNLFRNKTGIFLAVSQMILLWYAFKIFTVFDSPKHEMTWEVLFVPVFIINLPSIISSLIFCLPLYYLTSTETFLNCALYVFPLTVVLQWLLIGKIISNFFSSEKSKAITFSLENE